jgi:hypothetical protein
MRDHRRRTVIGFVYERGFGFHLFGFLAKRLHRLEAKVRTGELKDYDELVQIELRFSPARIAQIAILSQLAPAIQRVHAVSLNRTSWPDHRNP